MAKARKNPAEVAGHRAASLRDGAALARFLKWIAAEAPKGGQTELSAAAKLEELRRETGLLKDLSFDAISATGPHGAIPYHVTEDSDLAIEPGQLYLINSGGQYEDGTTDVTRVVPIGAPTAEMRDRFTRVLKGHIALATAVFPQGTSGQQLDALARLPLWQAGLDFAHGTGHGVGAYLAVHEGPARIAKPSYPGGGPQEPLRAGMILSNEPGYYKGGRIRHPDREPAAGGGARPCGWRGEDAGVRDVDAGADRSRSHRSGAIDVGRAIMDQWLPCGGGGQARPADGRGSGMAHVKVFATRAVIVAGLGTFLGLASMGIYSACGMLVGVGLGLR
ncbi:M24B family metallopeptidase [Sphingomonas sp. MMS24-JH45]